MIDIVEILIHWYAGRSQHELATNATSGADRETLAFHVERMMQTLVEPSP